MKIAIPLFGTRVSPRFTCTDQFLLVEVEKGEIVLREIIPVSDSHPLRCTRTLVDQGVDILICGGINRFSEQQLNFHNIKVFSWIAGEVDEVLENFLKGDLVSNVSIRSAGRWRAPKGMGYITKQYWKESKIFNSKEVNTMPKRDGTGPGGEGPGTGRGQGPCKGGKKRGKGTGRGQGAGGGRGQTAVSDNPGSSNNP